MRVWNIEPPEAAAYHALVHVAFRGPPEKPTSPPPLSPSPPPHPVLLFSSHSNPACSEKPCAARKPGCGALPVRMPLSLFAGRHAERCLAHATIVSFPLRD